MPCANKSESVLWPVVTAEFGAAAIAPLSGAKTPITRAPTIIDNRRRHLPAMRESFTALSVPNID
jgi:hypothetical protein